MENEHQAFEIIALIRKLQDGRISGAERTILEHWIIESEQNRVLFEQLMDEGYKSEAIARFQKYDAEAAFERVKQRLANTQAENKGRIRRLAWRIAAVAASLFLAALVFFNRGRIGNWINPVQQQTVATKVGERKIILLADGSKIWLAPASSFSYPDRFNAPNREVTLTGEAFFEIAKDKSHPFLIHSGTMLTRVVGTSFNIRAYAEQKLATVTVVTGIVSVAEFNTTHKLLKQVRLRPFEQAVLDKSRLTLIARQYPLAKAMLQRKDGIYHYDGTPVLQIIEDLKKNYNVHIVVSGDLQRCRFYGDLSSQDDVYKFLQNVCLTINAQIQRNGNTIIITGDGC